MLLAAVNPLDPTFTITLTSATAQQIPVPHPNPNKFALINVSAATYVTANKTASATASTLSGPIATLGSITAGSTYTNGSYPGTALTGGSGKGATANITVAGNVVTAVTLVNPGTGYVVADTLSATLPAGSGFSIPVATINQSALSFSNGSILLPVAGTYQFSLTSVAYLSLYAATGTPVVTVTFAKEY